MNNFAKSFPVPHYFSRGRKWKQKDNGRLECVQRKQGEEKGQGRRHDEGTRAKEGEVEAQITNNRTY